MISGQRHSPNLSVHKQKHIANTYTSANKYTQVYKNISMYPVAVTQDKHKQITCLVILFLAVQPLRLHIPDLQPRFLLQLQSNQILNHSLQLRLEYLPNITKSTKKTRPKKERKKIISSMVLNDKVLRAREMINGIAWLGTLPSLHTQDGRGLLSQAFGFHLVISWFQNIGLLLGYLPNCV